MNPKQIKLQRQRKGLSLLEVILAIAILGVAMAVLYQMIGVGYRSAIETRARTDANILLDTKMAEVAAGVIPLENAGGVEIAENPDWDYSVDVAEAEQIGLLSVTVTIEQTRVDRPLVISVVRFMPDPEYDPNSLEQQ